VTSLLSDTFINRFYLLTGLA